MKQIRLFFWKRNICYFRRYAQYAHIHWFHWVHKVVLNFGSGTNLLSIKVFDTKTIAWFKSCNFVKRQMLWLVRLHESLSKVPSSKTLVFHICYEEKADISSSMTVLARHLKFWLALPRKKPHDLYHGV